MSEKKFTPGPWEWVGRDLESNCPSHYEAVIETSVSCGQFCYGGSVNLKISDADKHLIAAAPDLLEALRACCEHMEWSTPQGHGAYADAQAAIDKATGAQS